MKVHGSCHCEAITFVAETDPQLTSVCHCHDCQKLTGTAFRVSTPALPGTFSLLRGTPKVYVKVAESKKGTDLFMAQRHLPKKSENHLAGLLTPKNR